MVTSVFPSLENVRDHLALIDGVATCAIGLEANMTPDAYPMIRIVPSGVRNGSTLSSRVTPCLIYFGQPIHEFTEGYESQWATLMEFEAQIVAALRTVPGISQARYIETITDEGRTDAYMMLAVRAEIVG